MNEHSTLPIADHFAQAEAAERQHESDAVLDELKDDINAFLWTRLPATMTLERAEEIAVQVHGIIADEWRATRTASADSAPGKEPSK